jgi:virginiamycin B lyase
MQPEVKMSARLVAAALVWLAAPLMAQQPALDEWQVPWERSRPRDPYVAGDGRVWFVGQTADYAAVFDPATGDFRRYELGPGVGPHNLIVDRQGMVWFAGNRVGYIGRLDPRDGSITRFPMPDSSIRDPHTLVFDSRGDIWFTAQTGNAIGKLTVSTGEVRLVRVPTSRARPYGIVVDRGDRPWVVLFGTNKLATVDPRSFELTEHELPRPAARPRRIALTSDGAVWYGDYAGGMLGRFDPATRQFQEWPLPGGEGGRPYAMMSDDRDRVWVVETGAQPNVFVGFDARARRFVGSSPVPSGGGTVRHMYYDPRTQSIWFGTDTNYLGRARVTPPQP